MVMRIQIKTGIMGLNRGIKCKKYLEINTLYINNHATIKKDCVRMSVGQYMFISIYIHIYIYTQPMVRGWVGVEGEVSIRNHLLL